MVSIHIDWMKEYRNSPEKWANRTVYAIEEKIKDLEKEELRVKGFLDKLGYDSIEELEECMNEDYSPMMNYGHLLVTEPSEEAILECAEKTGCCVMENKKTEECFIGLTGGGMNLSQNIGLAYVILERWIPLDLIKNIHKQKNMSISGDNWDRLRESIIKQLDMEYKELKTLKEDWEKTTSNNTELEVEE